MPFSNEGFVMDRNLVNLLRIAAALAGAFWMFRVFQGWSGLQEYGGFMKGLPAYAQARNELLLNFAGALSLILVGIFFKPSDDKSEKEGLPSSSSTTSFPSYENQSLEDDGYKIYLTKKYQIEKSDVLGKFICRAKLFDSVELALAHADQLEKSQFIEAKPDTKPNEQIIEVVPQKIHDPFAGEVDSGLKKIGEEAGEQVKDSKSRRNILVIVTGIALLTFGLIMFGDKKPDFKLASHETPTEKSTEKSIDTEEPTDEPYRLYRDQLLADSWKPYIRENRITTWDPPYPEVIYCVEDSCSGHFINERNGKVKEVFYSICWAGRYVDCPGKPNGYERVDREKVWSKSASDKEWERLKRVRFD